MVVARSMFALRWVLVVVLPFVSRCACAQGAGKWLPVTPGGPDSSPDYSWEENSSTNCLRPTDDAYNARLEALSKLLFGTAPTANAGCVTGVYLENGYSALIPQMAHHAGIDFRIVDGATRVYSPISGKVVLASLDSKTGASTLTIRTEDDAYNVLLLHCSSHEHRRNGLPVPALKEGATVVKGDQVCIAGSIGAAAAHLHVEVKRVGQDAGRLKAMFGGAGACKKSPCTLADVRANTVDPTVLVAGSGTPSGSSTSQVPTSGAAMTSATVRDDQAQFTFPINPQRTWEWCDGGGAGMPYGWNVKVANAGKRYEFGFSTFSTQGAGSCHQGNFEKLLGHGQLSAWKVNANGGSLIQGAQVKYAISDGGKRLHIILNDRKTIDLLFSGKPKIVTFESVIDWNKTLVHVPVVYVPPLAGKQPVFQRSNSASTKSATFKEQLAAQMVKNAYNPAHFKDCLRKSGGIDNVVDMESYALSLDGSKQYLVTGKNECAIGARMPLAWIYEMKTGAVRILADLGPVDGVEKTRNRTMGYLDIKTFSIVGAGSEACVNTYRFDGSQYRDTGIVQCNPLNP